jgi:hypothetical protein
VGTEEVEETAKWLIVPAEEIKEVVEVTMPAGI